MMLIHLTVMMFRPLHCTAVALCLALVSLRRPHLNFREDISLQCWLWVKVCEFLWITRRILTDCRERKKKCRILRWSLNEEGRSWKTDPGWLSNTHWGSFSHQTKLNFPSLITSRFLSPPSPPESKYSSLHYSETWEALQSRLPPHWQPN